jgi:hypothetical protein
VADIVSCRVSGHWQATLSDPGAGSISVTRAASEMWVEAAVLIGSATPVATISNGKLFLKCPKMSAAGAVIEATGGTLQVDGLLMESTASYAVRVLGGSQIIRADQIKGVGPAVKCEAPSITHVTARELVSTANYGLHLTAMGDSTQVFVNGARVQSYLNTALGKAVYLDVNGLVLKDCVLLSNVAGVPAVVSVDAPNARNVMIYGSCTANMAKGVNITFTVGNARFESSAAVF